MASGLGLLAASVLLFPATEEELTLQQVLKANTAAINAIRSIHVAMDVSIPGAEPSSYRLEWYKDGARDRERMDWLGTKNPNNLDISNGPDGSKGLFNYDPTFTPSLSESIARPAIGELRKKTQREGAVGSRPRAQCYMNITPGTSLEEHVARYPTSKLVATPTTSKFGCYEITTVFEGELGPERRADQMGMRVFVDPAAGFWIRRIEKKGTEPGDKGATYVHEVQEFKECGNGIFWPMRAHHTVRYPGRKEGGEVSIRYTLHSLNEALPDEDFAIHFPDWVRVYDRDTGQVFVWGPNDQPRLTFASEGEYLQWYTPRAKEAFAAQSQAGPGRRLAWIVGVNIVFVALLILIVVWRRNRRQTVVKGAL
jgi:hypothetical protein